MVPATSGYSSQAASLGAGAFHAQTAGLISRSAPAPTRQHLISVSPVAAHGLPQRPTPYTAFGVSSFRVEATLAR